MFSPKDEMSTDSERTSRGEEYKLVVLGETFLTELSSHERTG